MSAFIILLIVLLAIGLVIGFISLVETVVIVWIGSLLGLAVPFNLCFFIVLVWNFFFGGGTISSSKD